MALKRTAGEASADGVGQSAFEKATGPYWQAIYGLVYRMVRNRAAAEDLFQETLLRALKRYETLRDKGTLKAWLLRIAHNTTLNWIRKERPQVPVDFVEDLATFEAGSEGHGGSPVEEAIERSDEAQRVTEAMAQLPAIYRSILQMRYGEGMAYKELGEALGIPMSSVKFRLHQGVALLKGRLKRTAEGRKL